MDSNIYTFLLETDGTLVTVFNPSKNRPTSSQTLLGAQWMGIHIILYSLDRNMDKINIRGTKLARCFLDMFAIHDLEIVGDIMVRLQIEDPYPIGSFVGTRRQQVEKVLDELMGYCSMKEEGDMPGPMKTWLETRSIEDPSTKVQMAEGINRWGQVISDSQD